eukprot:SAG11_NODE_4256_length_1984_cov_1.211141_2_plen_58_part_00
MMRREWAVRGGADDLPRLRTAAKKYEVPHTVILRRILYANTLELLTFVIRHSFYAPG